MYQFFSRYCKTLLILTFSLLLSLSSFAQAKIDSLKLLLNDKKDSIQIDLLIQLTRESVTSNLREAYNFIEQANHIAIDIGDTLGIVRTSRIKGQILRRLDRLEDAIKSFETALVISRRHNKNNLDFETETIFLLNGLAITHTFLANYDWALELHFQSLQLREKQGDKSEISITLNNIGLVYFKLKNYELALTYYKKSLENKIDSKDNYDIDRLYVNIGLCYIHLKDFEKALENFDKAFKICGDNCSEEIITEGEGSRGVAYYWLGNMNEATVHLKKALLIARKTGNHRFQAETLVYLGKIDLRNKDFDHADILLAEAEQLALKSGYNQLLIDIYKEFSNLFNQSEQFEKASVYQNKYISLKDSLFGEDLVKNISRIQTAFEERENLNIIKLKEEDLARQRNLNIAIGIIAILAGLLVFVLYRSNAITRKVNSALSDAKGVIETQNQRLQNINRELDSKVKEKTADLVNLNEELDRTNKALVRVNDELDNFIYKTSHDIRGPLASLKGICSVALMDVKDPLALDYLTKLDVSSGRLNVILTRLLIVNQINHAVVGREPIDFDGIIDDVLLLERKKGLPPRLEVRKDIEKNIHFLSDKDLVRIILENLIDNSIKFYNDSERTRPFVHIKISLQNDKDVVVSVIDNGIGIAEAKPDKIFQMFSRASERSGTGGIGLYLSKLATEKLGGQINLRNTPEGYTEFYVFFPLKMHLG